MVDLHTHLIPKFDDGSKSLEETLSQFKQMADGGIKHVFLTSHYMRGHYSYTRQEYMSRFNELESEVKHQNIDLDLHPGFEVHLHPGIENTIQSENLTLGDSSYVLVETDLNGLPVDFYHNIFMILHKGFKPILAHAERYVTVMKHSSEAKNLALHNVYIQVNAGSLTGYYGDKVKQTAWKLVNRGYAHFLGSDDHGRGSYEHFFQAKRSITNRVDSHTANLLCEKHGMKVVNNEKVDIKYVDFVPVPSSGIKKKKSLLRSIFG
ncbi:MAG: capsular biosynthesis protein [Candidatus Cloacimonetes bacterium]|nr:capsular biosynthesis protein [Candidatus Cloacimonadota bacterium]